MKDSQKGSGIEEYEGEVTLINRDRFRVRFVLQAPSPSGETTTYHHEIEASLSGRLRKNHIQIVKGDKVLVEIPACDPDRGRIVRRLDASPTNRPPSVSHGKGRR
jgi:hypothetical protein